MKIGILTIPLHQNYGGIIQNYALQKVLIQLGHTPITIDKEKPKKSFFRFYLSKLKYFIYSFLNIKVSGIFSFQLFERNEKFESFIRRNINLTRKVRKLNKNLITKYGIDCVVAGSDQIWRNDFFWEDDLRNNYLEFLKDCDILKIAYAASFGINYWDYEDELTKTCKALVNQFEGVSTREDSGVILCDKYLGKKAVPVSDPTLLLSKDDYVSLCRLIPPPPKKNRNKFLFVYCLDISSEYLEDIKSEANARGWNLIIAGSELNANMSVEEWLAMFRDAEYVITDSFHGTVFSIIFNKPFSTLLNETRGNDRFMSLLGRFDLNDRIYHEGGLINDKDIDWVKTTELIQLWKERSIAFLKRHLSN